MVSLPLFQSELSACHYGQVIHCDMSSQRSLLKDYLSFHYLCPQLYLLRRFVGGIVCLIGMGAALLFGGAEYIHTQGMVKQNLENAKLAFRLFPWDFRFRTGLVQIADSQNDINTLIKIQEYDPKSVSLMLILANHYRAISDNVGAAKQIRMALELKRN